MCIAIVKPQGTTITDKCLETCFINNPDGAGIAYAKDGQLYIVKGIFDVKQFISEIRKAEAIAEGDMLIHCRIGTSGKKDKNNCHPHIVNDSLVMIHNGILDIDVPLNSKVSDTVIFTEEYLKNLPKDFTKNKAIMKLIEFSIGSKNKFAFLNNKGESFICNQKAGVVEGGIWYSNETFRDNLYDFFYYDREQEEAEEIYEYFEDYILGLEDDEIIALGDYPLINTEEYSLEPFSADKESMDEYISLMNYSNQLYWEYFDRYQELTEYRISAWKEKIWEQ